MPETLAMFLRVCDNVRDSLWGITKTQRISDHYASKSERVTAFFEGDDRMPWDFFETAGIPVDEFDVFRAQYPETPDGLWGVVLRAENYGNATQFTTEQAAAFPSSTHANP